MEYNIWNIFGIILSIIIFIGIFYHIYALNEIAIFFSAIWILIEIHIIQDTYKVGRDIE